MPATKNQLLYFAAQGWLEIEITGLQTAQLLNLALQQGIALYQVRHYGEQKLTARLLLHDIYALRPLLRATHCRFTVRKRAGRPFWLARAWHNFSLLAGGLLAALGFYLICSCIWLVDVTSPYPVTAAEREKVLELAKQAGLSQGRLALNLDYDAINSAISAGAPELIFVQAKRNGVVVTLHIVKRADVTDEERYLPPGDIVAIADGLIENILVKSGQAAVNPGDTAKAGDVLVYGLGAGKLTAASALITARIWGEGIGSWPLQEQGLRPSGFSSRALSLRFGNDEDTPTVQLTGSKAPPYDYFHHSRQVINPVLWRNIILPVEFILDTWYEQQPYVTGYTKEQALYHAGQRALDLAVQKLPGGCELLSQTVQELPGDASRVYVRVIWEARADIGHFVPLDTERKELYEEIITNIQNTPE